MATRVAGSNQRRWDTVNVRGDQTLITDTIKNLLNVSEQHHTALNL